MNPLSHIILEIDRLLESYPELQDDELLRLDTIEGETDALEIAARLVRWHNHAKAMEKAVAQERADLFKRQERYKHQTENAKTTIETLMRAMDVRKLELAGATVSMRAGSESVVVDDVDELPQGCFSIERKADKAAIKASIKAGDTIPGARLERGADTISVRVL
jgi:hypothetical protein